MASTVQRMPRPRRRLRRPLGTDGRRGRRWPALAASHGGGVRPSELPEISVVIPVYRAEDLVDQLVARLREALSRLTPSFEVVLVEDGSNDASWSRIREACVTDNRIKAIRLSRNFGQHRAIVAGLDRARGRFVVVMDCDLQDDPDDIAALRAKALEGYDIVFGTKEQRAHQWSKNLTGRLYASTLNWLAGNRHADPLIGSFSLLSRRAHQAFRRVSGVRGHYLHILRWLGFPAATVTVRHRPRARGRSSYSVLRLLQHAREGVTSHSGRLLYLGIGAGMLFLLVALLAAGLLVALYFAHGFLPGWTSIVVLILLSSSAVLLSVGVVGIYVDSMFEQIKPRPQYLTLETLNLPKPESPAPLDDRSDRAPRS